MTSLSGCEWLPLRLSVWSDLEGILLPNRLSWQTHFMANAEPRVLRWPSRAFVGAVFQSGFKRIIATGYNGEFLRLITVTVGHYMERWCWHIRTVQNECPHQYCQRGFLTKNTEIYVTHFPCINCTKLSCKLVLRLHTRPIIGPIPLRLNWWNKGVSYLQHDVPEVHLRWMTSLFFEKSHEDWAWIYKHWAMHHLWW